MRPPILLHPRVPALTITSFRSHFSLTFSSPRKNKPLYYYKYYELHVSFVSFVKRLGKKRRGSGSLPVPGDLPLAADLLLSYPLRRTARAQNITHRSRPSSGGSGDEYGRLFSVCTRERHARVSCSPLRCFLYGRHNLIFKIMILNYLLLCF